MKVPIDATESATVADHSTNEAEILGGGRAPARRCVNAAQAGTTSSQVLQVVVGWSYARSLAAHLGRSGVART